MTLTEDRPIIQCHMLTSLASIHIVNVLMKCKCCKGKPYRSIHPGDQASYSMAIISLIELVILLNTSIASSVNVLPTCVPLLSIADCACVTFTPSSPSSCSILSCILRGVGSVTVKDHPLRAYSLYHILAGHENGHLYLQNQYRSLKLSHS
jgi:hypothetical protein